MSSIPTRRELLEGRIAGQIELIAKLICEDKNAVEAERYLRELERNLVEEELQSNH